jgi:hypothetical protein
MSRSSRASEQPFEPAAVARTHDPHTGYTPPPHAIRGRANTGSTLNAPLLADEDHFEEDRASAAAHDDDEKCCCAVM